MSCEQMSLSREQISLSREQISLSREQINLSREQITSCHVNVVSDVNAAARRNSSPASTQYMR
jgi:hypothetical protein